VPICIRFPLLRLTSFLFSYPSRFYLIRLHIFHPLQMNNPAFSPTLTASSSSTAAQSYGADVDMTLDKGVQDFSEMFNFDEFESSVCRLGSFCYILLTIKPVTQSFP